MDQKKKLLKFVSRQSQDWLHLHMLLGEASWLCGPSWNALGLGAVGRLTGKGASSVTWSLFEVGAETACDQEDGRSPEN